MNYAEFGGSCDYISAGDGVNALVHENTVTHLVWCVGSFVLSDP